MEILILFFYINSDGEVESLLGKVTRIENVEPRDYD